MRSLLFVLFLITIFQSCKVTTQSIRPGVERSSGRNAFDTIVLPAYVPVRRGHYFFLFIKFNSMKKSKILTSQSYRHLKSKRENPVGKSMTIQGDAKSIKDLLLEHTQGIRDPAVERPGIFNPYPSHDDYDFQELFNMDLAEIDSIKQSVNQKLTDMQLKIKSFTEGRPVETGDPSDLRSARGEGDKNGEPQGDKRSNEVDEQSSPKGNAEN